MSRPPMRTCATPAGICSLSRSCTLNDDSGHALIAQSKRANRSLSRLHVLSSSQWVANRSVRRYKCLLVDFGDGEFLIIILRILKTYSDLLYLILLLGPGLYLSSGRTVIIDNFNFLLCHRPREVGRPGMLGKAMTEAAKKHEVVQRRIKVVQCTGSFHRRPSTSMHNLTEKARAQPLFSETSTSPPDSDSNQLPSDTVSEPAPDLFASTEDRALYHRTATLRLAHETEIAVMRRQIAAIEEEKNAVLAMMWEVDPAKTRAMMNPQHPRFEIRTIEEETSDLEHAESLKEPRSLHYQEQGERSLPLASVQDPQEIESTTDPEEIDAAVMAIEEATAKFEVTESSAGGGTRQEHIEAAELLPPRKQLPLDHSPQTVDTGPMTKGSGPLRIQRLASTTAGVTSSPHLIHRKTSQYTEAEKVWPRLHEEALDVVTHLTEAQRKIKWSSEDLSAQIEAIIRERTARHDMIARRAALAHENLMMLYSAIDQRVPLWTNGPKPPVGQRYAVGFETPAKREDRLLRALALGKVSWLTVAAEDRDRLSHSADPLLFKERMELLLQHPEFAKFEGEHARGLTLHKNGSMRGRSDQRVSTMSAFLSRYYEIADDRGWIVLTHAAGICKMDPDREHMRDFRGLIRSLCVQLISRANKKFNNQLRFEYLDKVFLYPIAVAENWRALFRLFRKYFVNQSLSACRRY